MRSCRRIKEGMEKRDGPGRIWLDVTTTRHAGGNSDGTTRIERGLIRELPQFLPGRLGYCAYSRTLGRFAAVTPPPPPDSLSRRREDAGKKSFVRPAGRAVERTVRRLAKAGIGRVASMIAGSAGGRPFAEAAAGDVLLLAGETWGRHDFDALRRLRQGGIRIAALLQDMIPVIHPQFFESAAFVARFRSYVGFLAKDADLVLAISEGTRRDFLGAAPSADPAKVVRIELGADIALPGQEERPAALGQLEGRPFVLSVSTIQVRKNFDLLYRLWQRFAVEGRHDQPHLVIVGRPGFGSADLLHLMRNDPWIAGTVTILDRASDAELAWLYRHCAFTLYPSWYEGWGLPISESLAYGKTFIASDRPSLPEAGKGLGIHLDPYDLMAWRNEVLRLANDAAARAAMEARIAGAGPQPTWSDCARSIAARVESIARIGP
jgi:glycosyltransferase involved in cell wall biosynthesis